MTAQDAVDDLRRNLVHAVLVARVGRDLLRISSSDSLWNDGVTARDELAAPELLHAALGSALYGTVRRGYRRRAPSRRIRSCMCRVLAYLGEPISLAHVLFETDSSLVRQSYSPRMMDDVPQPRRVRDGRLGPALRPGRGAVRLPRDDAAGVRPQPAQPGRQARPDVPGRARPRRHLRRAEIVAETNLHPFRFHGAASRWRTTATCASSRDALRPARPHPSRGGRQIEGTTDSEWIYALVLSQLEAVDKQVQRWLAEEHRPFFWFINLIECHSPYMPPQPYNDLGPLGRVLGAEDARRYQTLQGVWRCCATGITPPQRSLDRMRRLYDGSIRADGRLARPAL